MRALSLKDRALIVNKLLLSKLNHIFLTHHLPTNTLNNLNSIISRFIWRAKSNQVAHKTIIAKYKNGGLNLMDITAKKETFSLKIIKKALSRNESIWVDYFTAALESCGKAGTYNLCQTFPQGHYSSLDPFMREVMAAWRKVRPRFKVQALRAEHVLKQPITHNIDISSNRKPVLSQFFEKTSINTISDILDTNKNISIAKVHAKFQQNQVKYRKYIVEAVIRNITKNFPKEWKSLLKQHERQRQTDTLNFVLKDNKHNKLLSVPTKPSTEY